MSSFSFHYVRVPIYCACIVTSMCTHASVMVAIDVLVVVYDKKVGELGYTISSSLVSAGYLASILAEGT